MTDIKDRLTHHQLADAAYQHVTYTTIWGGSGKHGWKCSCGSQDWGTGKENPERYREYISRDAARRRAAEHVADAVLASLENGAAL